MKKRILAGLCVSATLCMLFTGCGQEKVDSSTKEETIVTEEEDKKEAEESIPEEKIESYDINSEEGIKCVSIDEIGITTSYIDDEGNMGIGCYVQISNTSDDKVIKNLKMPMIFKYKDKSFTSDEDGYISYIMPKDTQIVHAEFVLPASEVPNANLYDVQGNGVTGIVETLAVSNSYADNSKFEFKDVSLYKDNLNCNCIEGTVTNNAETCTDGTIYVTALVRDNSDNKVCLIISESVQCDYGQTTSFRLYGTEKDMPDDVTIDLYAYHFAY